ncbi:MAG: thiamine-phosphate kinase [Planctomycetota bacterium]
MELDFLRWLDERLPRDPRAPLKLDDDAAQLLGLPPDRCVLTSDLLAEGVHFSLPEATPARVGRKALAVNLSDLAAMAARPVAATVSILLPRGSANETARDCYEGLLALAEQYEVAIVGGDTNVWDGPLVISVTAIGEITGRGPLTRSAAQPGDAILVTGPLGGSREAGHLDFQPRVHEATDLHERYQLHAGMDISDGLLLDLSRMMAASGCGAELRLDQVPISDAAFRLACCVTNPRAAALEHALSDGEDFELLLTLPPQDAEQLVRDPAVTLSCAIVGQVISEPGLWAVDPKGQRRPLRPAGYEHD